MVGELESQRRLLPVEVLKEGSGDDDDVGEVSRERLEREEAAEMMEAENR